MSRELEALYKQIKERLANDDGKTHQTINIDISVSAMKEVIQALTPPTEQEVCEALGEFLNKKVYYEESPYRVFSTGLPVTCDNYIIEGQDDDTIAFNSNICELYPPHLITLIGRFYEGKVKDND